MSTLPSRSPRTNAVPDDGYSIAAAMRSSDVLPAPLGPMTTQRSSSSTDHVRARPEPGRRGAETPWRSRSAGRGRLHLLRRLAPLIVVSGPIPHWTGLWPAPCGFEPGPLGLLLPPKLAVRVGAAYGRMTSPQRLTPRIGNVNRCIVVGVPNEAAPATLKVALRAAIAFVHPATVAARLRRVGRIDFDERNPRQIRFVGQKCA